MRLELRLYSFVNLELGECWKFSTTWSAAKWDWLGDSWSWDDAVHGVCSTQWMLYLVYVILGVCSTWCWLLIMAWSDTEWWLRFTFSGDARFRDEEEKDVRVLKKSCGETGTKKKFVCELIYHPPIWQICVLIRSVITPIWGLQAPFGKAYPWFLMSLVSSKWFPLPTSILFFVVLNSTIIEEDTVKSSLSISLCHDHELTLSTEYIQYSICPRWVAFLSFSSLRVDQSM